MLASLVNVWGGCWLAVETSKELFFRSGGRKDASDDLPMSLRYFPRRFLGG
jgi:hypothetical protein